MKTEKAAKDAAKGLNSALDAGQAGVERLVGMTGELMDAGYRNAESLTKTQVEQLKEAQNRTSEVAAEQMKVVEELGQAMVSTTEMAFTEMAEFAKTSAERNLATLRRLSEAKDPTEWASVQVEAVTEAATQFARCALSMTKLVSDGSASLYGPFSRFVEGNVDKAKEAAGAK